MRNFTGDAFVFVYNPDDFEPTRYLPQFLHPYADCARVLVHLVETARIYNKLNDSDFVPRKAKYLRRLVHKEQYIPIRNTLLDAGVLEWYPHYVKGKQSYGFRIGAKFKGKLFRRYKLTDPTSIRRVQRVRAEQCPALTDDTLKGLQTWLSRLEMDYDAALSYLRTLPLGPDILRQRHLSLAMLCDGEFFFKPDLHGRVHTNLTNLWSEFRQFLRYKGECLVNIDIGNSQPLFFGLVVLNWIRTGEEVSKYANSSLFFPPPSLPFHYDAESIERDFSGINLPRDVKRYLHITEQALFYEHMMSVLSIPITKQSREGFKHDFFGKVFYCKPNYYTKERKAFREEFPTIFEHITRLKQEEPRNASLALQRAEGEFVIGTVCKRILIEAPDTPLWTIHDSIVTKASKGDLVRKVMEDEFAKLGVHPRLRIEDLAPDGVVCRYVQPLRATVSVKEIGNRLMDGNPPTVPMKPIDRQSSSFDSLSSLSS